MDLIHDIRRRISRVLEDDQVEIALVNVREGRAQETKEAALGCNQELLLECQDHGLVPDMAWTSSGLLRSMTILLTQDAELRLKRSRPGRRAA